MVKNFFTILMLVASGTLCGITEKPIAIISASYNNIQWYKKHLDSVFAQDYHNVHLYYTDDCSTDGTGDAVEAYVKEHGWQDKVTLIKNKVRVGALANQYNAIHQCSDDTIAIILDADDWFAHPGVLKFINNVYSKNDVWLTYGQFIEFPTNKRGFCTPMPEWVVGNHAFRLYEHIPSHLRTFYAGLFKKIQKDDLMLDGQFYRMTGDMATMIPMIEMAADHYQFVPNILLVYNTANELNDHKVSKELQSRIDKHVRSLPRYPKLQSLFSDNH